MLSTVFTFAALLAATASASPILVSRQISSAGWGYKGCFTEATGQRALIGFAYFDDKMTQEICASACASYTYFGVEYGRECWCSNTGLNEGSVVAPEEDCSFRCPGNPSQICGAGNRLTVYTKGTPTSSSTPVPTSTPSSAYTALGCYTDNASGRRSLYEASYYDDSLTIAGCEKLCGGYTYFGLEYGRECYCGNTLRESSAVSADECSFPCSGNSEQICGAGNRLSLYGTTPLPVSSSTISSSSTSSLDGTTSASSTEVSTMASSSSSSETTTASLTEVSTTSSSSTSSTTESSSSSTTTETPTLSSTTTSSSESSSSVSSTTTETPILSSTTTSISTTESPTTTLATSTTTSTTTTSPVPVETCLAVSPVTNSGFEIGTGSTATGWIPWSADSLGSFGAVANTVTTPHSGLRSYRIRAPVKSSNNRNSFKQDFATASRLCAGRTYTFESWIKVQAGVAAPGVSVAIGPINSPTFISAPSYFTSTEWQKFEGSFVVPTTPASAAASLFVYIVFPPTAVVFDLFMDDISITLAPL